MRNGRQAAAAAEPASMARDGEELRGQQLQQTPRRPTLGGGCERTVPAWVARLSRPPTASPRQETFCQPYDSVTPHSVPIPVKTKVPHLTSTHFGFSADDSLSSRASRRPSTSYRLARLPSLGLSDRQSSANSSAHSAKDAHGSPLPYTPRMPSLRNQGDERPATAPHTDAKAPGAARPPRLSRTKTIEAGTWDMDAIRQQLAKLQAAHNSPRSHKFPPGNTTNSSAQGNTHRIPAYPGGHTVPVASACWVRAAGFGRT